MIKLYPDKVSSSEISSEDRVLIEGLLRESKTLLTESAPSPLATPSAVSAKRYNLKVLLENEAASLKLLTEGLTTGANIAPLETYIYPVLTRALVNLLAYDLVSVQPVTSTLAQVRLLKFRHGVNRGNISEGAPALPSFESNVSFSPYYSGPYIEDEPWNRDSAQFTVSASGGTASKSVEYPITGNLTLKGTVGTTSFELDLTDAFGSSNKKTIITNIYAYRDTGNKVTILNDDDEAATFTNVTLSYVTSTEGFPISPEFELTLEKYPIEVEVRKLRATATLEALLDLSSHNVAYESDLAEIMSGELRVELDRTVIRDLLNAATSAGYTSTWDGAIPANWPRPVADYYRNLIVEIAKASAKIYRRTRRAPANWIVTSPDIAALLESAQLLVMGDTGITDLQGYGLIPLGIVSRRWRCYVDPLMPRNKILVGLKGASIYDAGAVFAPYVPAIPVLQPIRDVMVPEFAFHLGVYTAAGYKVIDPGFYHVITVNNLYEA